MSSKKRAKKGKPRGGAQLSGNPQRRAEQMAEREGRDPAPPEADTPWPPLAGGLGADLGPGFDWPSDPASDPIDEGPDPSWEPSHRRVIERSRRVEIPESPMAIDSLTCELVGDAYWDALRKSDEESERLFDAAESEDGFDMAAEEFSSFANYPPGWLNALADVAAQEVESARSTADWQSPWLLLRGMAAWAIYESEDPDPADPDPLGPVSTAIRRAGQALVDNGHLSRFSDPVSTLRPLPDGWPSVLHDAYGSRVALFAPFTYGADRSEPHWYYWDIDRCCLDDLVGAGVFPSREDAAAEWKSAVGASAQDGVEPRPCTVGEAIELLAIAAANPMLAGMRDGGEHRALIVEQFRMTSRAEEISIQFEDRLRSGPDTAPVDPDRIIESFRKWYADRNGEQAAIDDVAALFDEWGPPRSSPPLAFACSPHRIRHAVIVVEDLYKPEDRRRVVALLPEWVEWCLARTGLAGEPAEAARAMAHRVAEQGKLPFTGPEPEFRFREL